jgi:hypothetical protein
MFTYDEGPTMGGDGPNTNGTFGRELLSRLTTTLPGGQALQDQDYHYDAIGNLEWRIDQPSSLHAAPPTTRYTYDDLGRILKFETKFNAPTGSPTVLGGTYGYDPIGNLRSKDGAILDYGVSPGSAPRGRAAVSPLPHAVTVLTQGGVPIELCYDPNGSLAETRANGTPTANYVHSVRGKLIRVGAPNGTAEFDYDGENVRVRMLEGSDQTLEPFSGFRVTPSGMEKHYFANRRRIARRVGPSSSDVFWYHPEHLGSTNYMTSGGGTEAQDAYTEYRPFGETLPTSANNTAGAFAGSVTPISSINRSGGLPIYRKGAEWKDGPVLFGCALLRREAGAIYRGGPGPPRRRATRR